MVEILNLSMQELRKIAISGCHLHKWQGTNLNDVSSVFENQGSIQLDPLNPAGRNHDIFFFSRIKNYEQGTFERQAYHNKIVFESYFGPLYAIHVNHFQLFYPFMKIKHLSKWQLNSYNRLLKKAPNILEHILDFVKKNGVCTGNDLLEMESVDASESITYWKTSRLGGAGLDILWVLGKLAVVERDKNFRKKYDLIERYLEPDLLKNKTFDIESIKYERFLLKFKSSPIVNVPINQSKNGELRIRKTKKRYSLDMFAESVGEIKPFLTKIDNTSKLVAISPYWKKLLSKNYDNNMRAIAPLDPLIWERNITEKLFDFKYVWEVYKPKKDRKWGYYVYPLLFKGRFVGRLEAKYQKKKNSIEFFNFQKEKDYRFNNQSEKAFKELLNRWVEMLKSEKSTCDETITKIIGSL